MLWAIAALVIVAAAWGVYRAAQHGGVFGARGRPNVLLITLDTTRADYLGCYGRAAAQTPNMDRLAGQGMLFRRCSASSVQTLPSHSTIMTGLYPYVHGVRRNGTDQLPSTAVTLAEVFKTAGCATAAAIGSYVLDPRFGIAQGFDTYRAVPAPQPGVDPASAQRKGDKVADDALELLRTLARQRFFLWVHFYDPHYPYESSRVPDVASPAAYADEVAFMDGQIGRVLEELKKLGVEQNTLVVLVGDHGEGLNDHDEYQHGFFVYETGLHVPLILHGPGVVPASRPSTAVVRTVDVAPTILELSGLPPLADVQGTSLKPLIAGQVEDLRLAAYGEALEPHTLFRLSRLRSLIQGTWKYIHSSQPRLYDLANDPAELHDVVAEKPELAAALREQLRALLAEAPPPLAGETHVDLTTNEIGRLETLGYLGVVSDPNEAGLSELDTFAPAGADPHPHAQVLAAYERARDALGHNRFDAAEGQLRAVLASLPESPAPLRDLAFVLGRQAKVEEAIQTYEHVLAITPADTPTRAQYASLLMDAQRWDAAIAQSKQVLTQVPDDVAAHSMLGVALAKLERLDEAQSHLEAAVRVDPRNLNALYTLGQVYYKRHMLPEAADCFRKVLALEPRAERARAALQTVEREMQK